MMKKIVLLFLLAGMLLLTACGPREIPAKGDFTVRVFDDTPVRFAPDIYPLLTLRDRTVSIIW
jgi:hypothetical protein